MEFLIIFTLIIVDMGVGYLLTRSLQKIWDWELNYNGDAIFWLFVLCPPITLIALIIVSCKKRGIAKKL